MMCVLREDVWLAQQLGTSVFELFDCSTRTLVPYECESAFCYVRVPVHRIDVLHNLCEQGFYFVETTLTLERTIQPQSFSSAIREARFEDKDAVMELARNAFRFTRFHVDDNIPTDLANAIQAEWAGNFFSGERGDMILVAEEEGSIVGFHLACIRDDAQTLLIDLIAVSSGAQGKGFGRALIDMAQEKAQCAKVRTGTQLVNVESLAFYQNIGFKLVQSAYTLHRHPATV